MKTITNRITFKIRNLFDLVKQAFAKPAKPTHATPMPYGPVSMPYTNAVLLNLCGNDRGRVLDVMQWLAHPLRHPGTKLPNALWVRGGQGAGKSMFFGALIAPMYAESAINLPVRTFESWFNGWAMQKRLVLVEDFDFCAESAARTKLLLSSQHLKIERPGRAAAIERNQMNFIFMSGEQAALPMQAELRRFLILDSGAALPSEYYDGMAEEIRQGGVETYMDFLMDLSVWHDVPPECHSQEHARRAVMKFQPVQEA
jgi:hypothetical protein